MAQTNEIYQQTLKHLLAPVEVFLEDESVSEVMINGWDDIYVERAGKLEHVDARFEDEAALFAAMRNVAQYVGKRLVPENPSIEARLPDGSRVHIIQPPAARQGMSVAIRKFSKNQLDLPALVEKKSLSEEAAEFLGICMALAKNIIVSGGTGSGKTTLLNCLSTMIPATERILVLEDSSELQLQQDHVVSFEVQAPDRQGRGGISIRDLFRASLRMRPDRILVGECRGAEALDMIQAMTSGHSGSLSTLHANTPRDSLGRLETMALMANVGLPLFALRSQVASAVELIVQIARFHDGSRRITYISEVLGLSDDGDYRVQDLYRFRASSKSTALQVTGALEWTGIQPSFKTAPYFGGLNDRISLTRPLWAEQEVSP